VVSTGCILIMFKDRWRSPVNTVTNVTFEVPMAVSMKMTIKSRLEGQLFRMWLFVFPPVHPGKCRYSTLYQVTNASFQITSNIINYPPLYPELVNASPNKR
jgi:hypothetical protein